MGEEVTDDLEGLNEAEREFYNDPVIREAVERVNANPENRRSRPLRNRDRYVPEKPNTPRFGVARLGPSYALTDQQRPGEAISPIPTMEWAVNLLVDFNLNPVTSDNYVWSKLSSVGVGKLTPVEPDQTPVGEPMVPITLAEAERTLELYSGAEHKSTDYRTISKLWNFVESQKNGS
jgi:hypothetical protein